MKKLISVIIVISVISGSDILVHAQPGTWTWMTGDTIFGSPYGIYGTKGIADSNNTPPARYEASEWYRPQDNTFWLYGGGGSA